MEKENNIFYRIIKRGDYMKYNRDMTISQILFSDSRTIEVLHKYGLNCLNCLAAEKETLEIVCRVNDIDENDIIEDLNNIEKENACV